MTHLPKTLIAGLALIIGGCSGSVQEIKQISLPTPIGSVNIAGIKFSQPEVTTIVSYRNEQLRVLREFPTADTTTKFYPIFKTIPSRIKQDIRLCEMKTRVALCRKGTDPLKKALQVLTGKWFAGVLGDLDKAEAREDYDLQAIIIKKLLEGLEGTAQGSDSLTMEDVVSLKSVPYYYFALAQLHLQKKHEIATLKSLYDGLYIFEDDLNLNWYRAKLEVMFNQSYARAIPLTEKTLRIASLYLESVKNDKDLAKRYENFEKFVMNQLAYSIAQEVDLKRETLARLYAKDASEYIAEVLRNTTEGSEEYHATLARSLDYRDTLYTVKLRFAENELEVEEALKGFQGLLSDYVHKVKSADLYKLRILNLHTAEAKETLSLLRQKKHEEMQKQMRAKVKEEEKKSE